MCARGVFAVQRYFVIMMLRMPSGARKSAAEAPAGPDPTTTTSVSVAGPEGSAVSAMPSSNSVTDQPPHRRDGTPHRQQCAGVIGVGGKGWARMWRKPQAMADQGDRAAPRTWVARTPKC